MGWFILKHIFSTILSIIKITRLSNQEKDLEILVGNMGLFASLQDKLDQAREYLEQSLGIFNELGPDYKRESFWPLIFLAEVAFNQERPEVARVLYQESANNLRKIGDMY